MVFVVVVVVVVWHVAETRIGIVQIIARIVGAVRHFFIHGAAP
jgi:hypothetical protein